ncbi:hypothetical protein NLG97_g10663 [Lecanicillium saksenae]|uniref:Uncharacterized protein n=1 Tax=Lecanicillium saksenae TaxID=468837 RepID=A0ACC1QE87_9HYPO|nr:hypothetical protein NLG97_g10663 [Lecanicillium saksenae]
MHLAQTVRKSHRLFVSHHRSNGKRRYSGSGRSTGPHGAGIVWPSDTKPTPYQILNLEAGKPYEKTNFNHMVKMYHPDMHHSQGAVGDLSLQVRLHRYYLIIAAHELLSNPDQRRRYDLYKLGWMNNTPATEHQPRPSPENWQSEAYERPSPMRQSPIYTSNNAFAIFALVIAFGYAIVSYERARRAAWRQKQRMHLVDENIVKSLYDAEYLVAGKSKDERIVEFLCRRHVASGRHQDDGGFVPFDKNWEQNICRH